MRRFSHAALTATCAAVLATGCIRTVEGAGVAAETANLTTTTPTASQAPRALPVTALESLLLTADQLIALVGGTNMALVGTAASMSDSSTIIDERTCLGLGSVGDVTTTPTAGMSRCAAISSAPPTPYRPMSLSS